jgi:hypothetical protein
MLLPAASGLLPGIFRHLPATSGYFRATSGQLPAASGQLPAASAIFRHLPGNFRLLPGNFRLLPGNFRLLPPFSGIFLNFFGDLPRQLFWQLEESFSGRQPPHYPQLIVVLNDMSQSPRQSYILQFHETLYSMHLQFAHFQQSCYKTCPAVLSPASPQLLWWHLFCLILSAHPAVFRHLTRQTCEIFATVARVHIRHESGSLTGRRLSADRQATGGSSSGPGAVPRSLPESVSGRFQRVSGLARPRKHPSVENSSKKLPCHFLESQLKSTCCRLPAPAWKLAPGRPGLRGPVSGQGVSLASMLHPALFPV